jgi:hypothetical protein
MRVISLVFFSLLLLVSWSRALAQDNDAPGPPPVLITGERDEIPLGLHLELLEDPGAEGGFGICT